MSAKLSYLSPNGKRKSSKPWRQSLIPCEQLEMFPSWSKPLPSGFCGNTCFGCHIPDGCVCPGRSK